MPIVHVLKEITCTIKAVIIIYIDMGTIDREVTLSETTYYIDRGRKI